FDLAVGERRADPAAAERQVVVAPGGAVLLEEEAVDHALPEHELVGARPERRQARLAEHGAEARVAVLGQVGEGFAEVPRLGAGDEHQRAYEASVPAKRVASSSSRARASGE